MCIEHRVHQVTLLRSANNTVHQQDYEYLGNCHLPSFFLNFFFYLFVCICLNCSIYTIAMSNVSP